MFSALNNYKLSLLVKRRNGASSTWNLKYNLSSGMSTCRRQTHRDSPDRFLRWHRKYSQEEQVFQVIMTLYQPWEFHLGGTQPGQTSDRPHLFRCKLYKYPDMTKQVLLTCQTSVAPCNVKIPMSGTRPAYMEEIGYMPYMSLLSFV